MSHHHHHHNQEYQQGQGFNQQGFNQQGFNQQGFGGNNFGYGVGDFEHLKGGNFGQYGASYAIQSAMGKALDICQTNSHNNNVGDLIIYSFHGAKNQRFNISTQGQDLIIRSVQNGLVLEAFHGWGNNFEDQGKGRIRQAQYNGGPSQRWRIRRANNDHNQYFIINVHDGKCLDVEGGHNDNNNRVITYPYNGGKNQMWSIVPCAPGQTKLPHQSWWS